METYKIWFDEQNLYLKKDNVIKFQIFNKKEYFSKNKTFKPFYLNSIAPPAIQSLILRDFRL